MTHISWLTQFCPHSGDTSQVPPSLCCVCFIGAWQLERYLSLIKLALIDTSHAGQTVVLIRGSLLAFYLLQLVSLMVIHHGNSLGPLRVTSINYFTPDKHRTGTVSNSGLSVFAQNTYVPGGVTSSFYTSSVHLRSWQCHFLILHFLSTLMFLVVSLPHSTLPQYTYVPGGVTSSFYTPSVHLCSWRCHFLILHFLSTLMFLAVSLPHSTLPQYTYVPGGVTSSVYTPSVHCCGRSMCWTLWSVLLWEVHVLDLMVRAVVGGPCVGPYSPCGCGRSMCWTL